MGDLLDMGDVSLGGQSDSVQDQLASIFNNNVTTMPKVEESLKTLRRGSDHVDATNREVAIFNPKFDEQCPPEMYTHPESASNYNYDNDNNGQQNNIKVGNLIGKDSFMVDVDSLEDKEMGNRISQVGDDLLS